MKIQKLNQFLNESSEIKSTDNVKVVAWYRKPNKPEERVYFYNMTVLEDEIEQKSFLPNEAAIFVTDDDCVEIHTLDQRWKKLNCIIDKKELNGNDVRKEHMQRYDWNLEYYKA